MFGNMVLMFTSDTGVAMNCSLLFPRLTHNPSQFSERMAPQEGLESTLKRSFNKMQVSG
jgi:hypothetical protein